MQQKLSSVFLFVVLSALPLNAWATSLSVSELETLVPGLSGDEAAQLAEAGEVTHFLNSTASPRLIPDCGLTQSVEQSFTSVDQTIGVEALFIMKPGAGGNDARMLRWYNVLRSISTMKGIHYYSVTDGRMHVLFRASYVINNATQQDRLPDPLVSSIPPESDLTIKQDDSTLGEVLFRLHYQGAQDAISMSMVNLTTQYLWFMPIIGKHRMMLQLVLVPYKDRLIFYAGVEVKTLPLLGLQHATRHSIVSRVQAMRRWFEDTLRNR